MAGSDEDLPYDVMVENALRGVVREALERVAEQGLPGEHHFYITFRSDHPAAEVPETLRQRYPREMTIVLQYQYWDLIIGEDRFEVTLSFNNRSERLVVPFDSVVAFADPSVRFGLQFDAGEEALDEDAGDTPVLSGDQQNESPSDAEKPEESGEKVVTLDSFRKK